MKHSERLSFYDNTSEEIAKYETFFGSLSTRKGRDKNTVEMNQSDKNTEWLFVLCIFLRSKSNLDCRHFSHRERVSLLLKKTWVLSSTFCHARAQRDINQTANENNAFARFLKKSHFYHYEQRYFENLWWFVFAPRKFFQILSDSFTL